MLQQIGMKRNGPRSMAMAVVRMVTMARADRVVRAMMAMADTDMVMADMVAMVIIMEGKRQLHFIKLSQISLGLLIRLQQKS
mgnify:CR=1 FL=1